MPFDGAGAAGRAAGLPLGPAPGRVPELRFGACRCGVVLDGADLPGLRSVRASEPRRRKIRSDVEDMVSTVATTGAPMSNDVGIFGRLVGSARLKWRPGVARRFCTLPLFMGDLKAMSVRQATRRHNLLHGSVNPPLSLRPCNSKEP